MTTAPSDVMLTGGDVSAPEGRRPIIALSKALTVYPCHQACPRDEDEQEGAEGSHRDADQESVSELDLVKAEV